MNKLIQGIETGDGNTLIFDIMSGRFLYSDLDVIKVKVTVLNDDYQMGTTYDLNDVYSSIGMPVIDAGKYIRFDRDKGGCEVEFIKATDPIGELYPYYYMEILGVMD